MSVSPNALTTAVSLKANIPKAIRVVPADNDTANVVVRCSPSLRWKNTA